MIPYLLLQAPYLRLRPMVRRLGLVAPPVLFLLAHSVLLVLFFRLHIDAFIRIAYNVNTFYLPLCLLACAGAACVSTPDEEETVRKRRHRRGILWVVLAVLLAGLRIYATHIEPHRLQVREVFIESTKVAQPLKILHISDIQSAGIGDYEAAVFARIKALNPDIILHTGDLLQPTGEHSYGTELPKLALLFRDLNPPFGMYTVSGEADTPILHATPGQLGGIRFLHNQTISLRADGIQIRLLGLSLEQTRIGRRVPVSRIESWLRDASSDEFTIVLGHRPDYITRLLALPIDLCLAGHTHGGQIQIPFWGAIFTASGAPRDWSRGYREVGRTRINVSAGIGASHNMDLPSIRLNCPPEITLIHISPATESER